MTLKVFLAKTNSSDVFIKSYVFAMMQHSRHYFCPNNTMTPSRSTTVYGP